MNLTLWSIKSGRTKWSLTVNNLIYRRKKPFTWSKRWQFHLERWRYLPESKRIPALQWTLYLWIFATISKNFHPVIVLGFIVSRSMTTNLPTYALQVSLFYFVGSSVLEKINDKINTFCDFLLRSKSVVITRAKSFVDHLNSPKKLNKSQFETSVEFGVTISKARDEGFFPPNYNVQKTSLG